MPGVSFQSRELGVAMPASAAIAAKSGSLERDASMIAPASVLTPLSPRAFVGVGTPERRATFSSPTCTLRPLGAMPVIVVPSGSERPPFGVSGVGTALSCAASVSVSPGLCVSVRS
jgi:hypothetical protein